MSTEFLTLIVVAITFSLYIYIGWRAKAKDTKSFFVAGNDIPAIANGAAIAADWMSAASFISMAGLISFLGYDGTVYLMGWTGGYVLLTLLLAPYLRKFGRFTVPDFIGDRYYSNSARVIAVVATIIVSLTYVAGQMRGVGIVFSRYLQVDITTGIIIGMVIISFFSVVGGMKGITWTQVAQYSILMLAYLIPAVAISLKLTGIPIPQLALTFSDIAERLTGIQSELGFGEYIAPFQNLSKLNVFMVTMALMMGTAGLPHVIIRFYTVKTVRAARWSGVWAIIFIALLYTTAPTVGAFAKYNLIQSLNQQPIQQVREMDWVSKWETTGLLQIEDKNADGLLNISANEDTNELKIDHDIIVLSTPEVAGLRPIIIALVAAGGLAAALSTASGLLIAMSSAISHDLYYRIYKPDATEKERMLVARLVIFITVLIAGWFGINPPGFVGEVVAFAFGIAAASIFPALLMGIFDKRMNREGATAGMINGLVFTIAMILMMQSQQLFGTEKPMLDSFFGINAQGIGVVGMLINFATAFLASRGTPPPPKEIVQLVENIRMPSSD
ncbi:cation/acetate symporter [Natronincola peptidivorans]|uniref:Cation/acetate symporter n=1 Tax=Natronincola peptidivorans TaxID=426128 RepID=A0A1I0H094_9FIRM|nr:sodium:solute symporter family protein [Natronincola peptidivorans]SET76972.1 cation/acetate symporter [Natronincola peptidivorans]